MHVRANFKVIDSVGDSWEAMACQVAQVLTMLGPRRVIGVSHSHEHYRGTMIVWYWEYYGEELQVIDKPDKPAIGDFPHFPAT